MLLLLFLLSLCVVVVPVRGCVTFVDILSAVHIGLLSRFRSAFKAGWMLMAVIVVWVGKWCLFLLKLERNCSHSIPPLPPRLLRPLSVQWDTSGLGLCDCLWVCPHPLSHFWGDIWSDSDMEGSTNWPLCPHPHTSLPAGMDSLRVFCPPHTTVPEFQQYRSPTAITTEHYLSCSPSLRLHLLQLCGCFIRTCSYCDRVCSCVHTCGVPVCHKGSLCEEASG